MPYSIRPQYEPAQSALVDMYVLLGRLTPKRDDSSSIPWESDIARVPKINFFFNSYSDALL